MGSKWGMLMFIIVALTIYFGGFAYVAWRINSGLGVVSPYNKYLFCALMGMAIMTVGGFIASRYGMPFGSIIGNIGFISMGALGITASLFILNDIVNISNFFLKIKDFRYYSTLIALALAFIFCAWSLINTAFFLKIKEIKVPMSNLKVDSLKVVCLSDVHINAFTSAKSMSRIVDKVNALNPDIVAIAGDLVDTDISQNYQKYGLDKLKSKYGVFIVTGNHEYYAGLAKFLEACKSLNFKLLRNESYDIENVITVAGINDHQGQVSGFDESNISKAFENTDKNYPVLFLSHRPETFDTAAAQRNILQLSGHLHNGQIPPIEIVVQFFKYTYGLYKKDNSYMYLTAGTRWWGPPMRLFNFSEIPVITLERK